MLTRGQDQAGLSIHSSRCVRPPLACAMASSAWKDRSVDAWSRVPEFPVALCPHDGNGKNLADEMPLLDVRVSDRLAVAG